MIEKWKYYQYDTPLGGIVIHEDGVGIARIDWVVQQKKPKGDCEETPLIRKAYSQLTEYFNGRRQTFDLILRPRGTAFQQRVWQVLRKIPYGELRNYQEVAEALGDPNAARAVGMANNRNPLPIIIPCHRVIGSNGKLMGYAVGQTLKRALLEIEGVEL